MATARKWKSISPAKIIAFGLCLSNFVFEGELTPMFAFMSKLRKYTCTYNNSSEANCLYEAMFHVCMLYYVTNWMATTIHKVSMDVLIT